MYSGNCSLSPGTYRPSVFEPSVAFTLDSASQAQGQSKGMIDLYNPDTNESVVFLDARALYGNQDGSAIALEPTVDGMLAYFKDQQWMKVSDLQHISVGGRPAIEFDVTSDIADQLTWLFMDPYPNGWVPGSHLRVVLGDAQGTCLVLIAEHDGPASFDAFDRQFDALVQSIVFNP